MSQVNILSHVSPALKSYLVKEEDFQLGECIGKGAFGEVYKAKHIPTGKICAVKKMLVTEIVGKDLIDFCREVEVLVECDGMFLTPFYGWKSTLPLLIVTEFIPNGSLFNALRHRKGSPTLNGTHKTAIALGIAKGMATLHAKKIIHRDLKSLNILLDKRLWPCICDFGVSRFVKEGEEEDLKTKDVGTPHWMAPELFISEKYTNKVDVYAYGILLWEMLTETAPFKGKNGVQIAMAVCQNQERPAFPPNTNTHLKKFISACWHQDPDKRPTFEQIVKILENKKAMFDGCSEAAIDYMKKEIRDYEMLKEEEAASGTKQPPLKYNEMEFAAKNAEVRAAPAPKAVKAAANFDLLSKPAREGYEENLSRCISELTGETCPLFFRNIVPVFSPMTPPNILEMVFEKVYKLVRGNLQYFNIFMETDIPKKLPISTPAQINTTFNTMLLIATQRPTAICKEMLKLVNDFVNEEHATKILKILWMVLQNFNRMDNGWTVCDHLIKCGHKFIEHCPLETVKIFSYLLNNYSQFYQARYEFIIPLLLKTITSDNPEVVKVTYGLMIQYYSPKFVFDVSIIERHLDVKAVRKACLSFIMKQKVMHMSVPVMTKLLAMLPKKKAAYYAILCSCDRTGSGNSLLASGGSWMMDGKMSTQQVIDLLLVLMGYRNFRPYLAAMPEFVQFLNVLILSGEGRSAEISTSIAVKLIGARDEPTIRLIQSLAAGGFFRNLLQFLETTDNANLVRSAIYLADVVARVSWGEGLQYWAEFLCRKVLTSQQQWGLAALSALTSVCQYPEAKEYARDHGVLAALEQARGIDAYAPYLKVLIG